MTFLYAALIVICGLFGIVVLHFLFLIAIALLVKNRDYDKASGFYRFVLNSHIRLILFLSNVKIVTTGTEKLQGLKGEFLLVGNHRSDYDPLVTVAGLKHKKLAFISKPENFRIFIVGKVIRKCLYIAIDRENARNAMKTINRAAALIGEGQVSFAVYPEGTRNKEKYLLPFHDGVFKIAQKAGSPVVVVGIRGTENIRTRAPFKRTVVCLDVLEVISAERVKALDSHGLSDAVREILGKATDGK